MGADATPSTPLARVLVGVSGLVQGVGYRAFAQAAALRLGLHGGVRNLADGSVEVEAEGPRAVLEPFIEHLRAGPPAGRVERLDVRWESASGRLFGFHIRY